MKDLTVFALVLCVFIVPAFSALSGNCIDCVIIKGALQFTGEFNQQNPLHIDDLKNMKVVLNAGEYYGFINPDLNFEIHNVPSGKYTLEVFSRIFHFETLIIEVSNTRYAGDTGDRIDAYIFNSETRKRIKDVYPLKLINRVKFPYFEKVEEMTIGSFVKNPYFFMIALSAVMLYFVNKMPSIEELQQEQQQESRVGNN